MDDGEKKDSVEAPKPSDSRTGIMLMLSPVIETALKTANLDMSDPDILRRYYRAMVHLALQKLLDVGAPPDFLVALTLEALEHELEHRAKHAGEGPNVPPALMSN